MLKSLQKKLAIDLGSDKIRILTVNDALIEDGNLSANLLKRNLIEDYACVARQKSSGRIIAIGADALEMQGRLAKEIEVIFPFNASRIIDEPAAKFLIQSLLKKSLTGVFINAVVMLTTVAEASEFSRQALSQFFYDLGFAEVYLLSQPLAAAIGSGVPTAMTKGVLFFQMGASRKEASIIALGSVMAVQGNDWAGQAMNKKIDLFLQKNERLQVSQQSLEKVKRQVVAINKGNERSLMVLGKTLPSQSPREARISSEMLRPLMQSFAEDCQALLNKLLKDVSPELLDDVLDRGMLLSGALAQLPGLEAYLTRSLGIPVAVVEEPELAALEGTVLMLASLEQFRGSLTFAG